jgi:hypothetical protein
MSLQRCRRRPLSLHGGWKYVLSAMPARGRVDRMGAVAGGDFDHLATEVCGGDGPHRGGRPHLIQGALEVFAHCTLESGSPMPHVRRPNARGTCAFFDRVGLQMQIAILSRCNANHAHNGRTAPTRHEWTCCRTDSKMCAMLKQNCSNTLGRHMTRGRVAMRRHPGTLPRATPGDTKRAQKFLSESDTRL